MSIEPLFATPIGRGDIAYAQGIKAGRWVFATGLLATDFVNGVDPAVLRKRLPRTGRPKNEREAAFIFARLERILQQAGTDLSQVVRLDQYYRSWKNVDPYHTVRSEVFGKYIPASTSILQEDLLLPDADMDIQAVAIVPQSGFQAEAVTPEGIYVPPQSGHTPVVRAGDFLFLAGQLARGPDGNVPAEARVPSDHLWKGTQIKLEADYIISQKLAPALEAAGSSLQHVVKAQVYLEEIDDLPAFNEVWIKYFPSDRPAITYVPTASPGFGTVGTHAEVNVVALACEGQTRKEIVAADVFIGIEGQAAAVRAGDMLFLSGLMAIDGDGLIAEAGIDRRQPYFGSPAAAQMRCILNKADVICRAAGTSLENVVRVQQFHTHLAEFQATYEVWRERLGNRPLPFSAVGVPEPLSVPGCSVLLDLWIYAPR